MNKHTPGPWTAEKNNSAHKDQDTVYIVGPLDEGRPTVATLGYESYGDREERGEKDANARLIAAVPLMLQALGQLVKENENGTHDSGTIGFALARAAIAAAEGE